MFLRGRRVFLRCFFGVRLEHLLPLDLQSTSAIEAFLESKILEAFLESHTNFFGFLYSTLELVQK